MIYEAHEYADLFPMMLEDDFSQLKTSMSESGYDESLPIVLFNGLILDGRNRYKAASELNIKPVFTDFTGTDEQALSFVLRHNLNRRHLNASQKAALAVDLLPIFEKQAKKRQSEAVSLANSINPKKAVSVVANLPPLKNEDSPAIERIKENTVSIKSREQAAAATGASPRYVSEAKKIAEESPELFKQIKSGEKTIQEIKKEQKTEQRRTDIEQQKKDIEESNFKQPDGLFDVIAIDPPWAYGREYDPETSRVANPYPEMPQSELLKIELPVKNDAVLFLWTTHAFIFDAKELMDKWGFTYKACMVWNKEKIGMGAWLRMQCEFCLVGIKGKPFWNNTTYRDIISSPRREHSRKPDEFFDMVANITAGRRLEYFSREKRDGWEIFGNDTNKF